MTIQHFSDAGWGNEDWGLVSTAVRETIETTARVRSLLPRGPAAPLAYNVVVPAVNVPIAGAAPPPPPAPLSLNTAGAQLPIRISRNFLVRVDQLHDRDAILRVARRAAHIVAAAEDVVLLFGGFAQNSAIAWQVETVNLTAATPGISAPFAIPVAPDPTQAVQDGIASLETRGYFEPYAVVLNRPMWAQTAADVGDREQKDAIREILGPQGALEPVADPRFYNGAGMRFGVVFARAAQAFDFVEIEPPSVAFVNHAPAQDGILLRVEERFVLRVMDPLASQLIAS